MNMADVKGDVVIETLQKPSEKSRAALAEAVKRTFGSEAKVDVKPLKFPEDEPEAPAPKKRYSKI